MVSASNTKYSVSCGPTAVPTATAWRTPAVHPQDLTSGDLVRVRQTIGGHNGRQGCCRPVQQSTSMSRQAAHDATAVGHRRPRPKPTARLEAKAPAKVQASEDSGKRTADVFFFFFFFFFFFLFFLCGLRSAVLRSARVRCPAVCRSAVRRRRRSSGFSTPMNGNWR